MRVRCWHWLAGQQAEAAHEVVKQGLSVRATEHLVKKLLADSQSTQGRKSVPAP